MRERVTRDVARLPRPVRVLAGVLLFVLLGPPVGGMVAWLGMGAPTLRSPAPFIAGSWLEGGVLALATGLLTALAAARGVTAWFVPVVAAALVTATFIVATSGGDWPVMARVAVVLMPPALVAALACGLLARPLFRR